MYQPENVKLYVKPVCGWCRQAEHWLKSQGIEFETIDVIEDLAAFEEMERISGQTMAPVIAVDGLRSAAAPLRMGRAMQRASNTGMAQRRSMSNQLSNCNRR